MNHVPATDEGVAVPSGLIKGEFHAVILVRERQDWGNASSYFLPP